MATLRLILVIFLIAGVSGCNRQASGPERAKAKAREAIGLLPRSAKLSQEWVDEYTKAFTEENRAKFPSNRASLSVSAGKIMAILDESSSLSRQMAEQFEEVGKLSTSDQDRKGSAMVVEALRKSVEVDQLLKSQMRLVFDEKIKDAKTLNEKIKRSWELIQEKQRESSELLAQGKRVWGIK